jgi:hypothetical protein
MNLRHNCVSNQAKVRQALTETEPNSASCRSVNMRLSVLALLTTLASPAMADGYDRIIDRGAFVNLVSGKSLTSLGVSLTVSPSGAIRYRRLDLDRRLLLPHHAGRRQSVCAQLPARTTKGRSRPFHR